MAGSTPTDPTSIQDLVGMLTDQHQQVKQLLPRVLQADGDQRAQLFTQVRRTLAAHEAFEQETIRPVSRVQVGGDEAAARIGEEQDAASAFASLEGMDLDSDEFTGAYQQLCDDVVQHAEHEEHDEFPQLDGELTDEAAQMAGRLQQLLDGPGPAGATFADMLDDAQQQFRSLA